MHRNILNMHLHYSNTEKLTQVDAEVMCICYLKLTGHLGHVGARLRREAERHVDPGCWIKLGNVLLHVDRLPCACWANEQHRAVMLHEPVNEVRVPHNVKCSDGDLVVLKVRREGLRWRSVPPGQPHATFQGVDIVKNCAFFGEGPDELYFLVRHCEADPVIVPTREQQIRIRSAQSLIIGRSGKKRDV